MRKQNRYTIWIETESGEKNPVEINVNKKDIESYVKKWDIAKRIFIEDIELTEKNQRIGIKTDEWGYIEIIKVI